MNREKLQETLTSTYQAYRADLEAIANSADLEPAEKLEKAQACYRVLTDTLRDAGTAWSEKLDEHAGDLEKVLYHGPKSYQEAVRQLSGKSEQELEETARIASRTGDTEYQELLQIPSPDEREAFVRQFAPPPPQPHDLKPSQQELRRREQQQIMEQASRLQAQANANAGALTGNVPPPPPRKFVGGRKV